MSIFVRKKTGKKSQTVSAKKNVGSAKLVHHQSITTSQQQPLQNGFDVDGLGFESERVPSLIPSDIQDACLAQSGKYDTTAITTTTAMLMRRTSCLNKSLHTCVSDKHALPYLIQYLDGRQAGHLLRFWLAADSFASSANISDRPNPVNHPNPSSQQVDKSVCDNGYSDSVVSASSADVACDHQVEQQPSPAASVCSNHDVYDDDLILVAPDDDASLDMLYKAKLKRCIEKDAVNIYSTYISLDAKKPIGISEQLRNDAIGQICREDGQVDAQCFTPCQNFAFDRILNEYYSDFLTSELHCQHQIDVLTAGSPVTLADILYSESALFYFMEYMEQQAGMRLLQCWQDLDSFEGLFSTPNCTGDDGQQMQSDAMVLYDKYFSLQALSPLGFHNAVRFEVENNICCEAGPLATCFRTPKTMVLHTINKLYFSEYLRSDVYFKFLSELITTVQTAPPTPAARRKRTESEGGSSEMSATGSETASCGDARSISSVNTLLAGGGARVGGGTMGAVRGMTRALDRIDADMSIDTTLFNPDALWQRSRAGDMSLGKINEAGQFVSELDPEPDRSKKKKSSSFFQRRTDNEQTQEDMAMKIAMMIIGEVNISTHQPASDTDVT